MNGDNITGQLARLIRGAQMRAKQRAGREQLRLTAQEDITVEDPLIYVDDDTPPRSGPTYPAVEERGRCKRCSYADHGVGLTCPGCGDGVIA